MEKGTWELLKDNMGNEVWSGSTVGNLIELLKKANFCF